MPTQKKEYDLIYRTDAEQLKKAVSAMCKEGWDPLGAAFSAAYETVPRYDMGIEQGSHTFYFLYQTMVRDVE
jgi:hypothetical protein